MMATLNIKANTEVLGFYQKQKSEFHFQEKTDNEFLMFLLDTAVRVISIVQHLAPVIEAVSDASADAHEDFNDDENFDSDFPSSTGNMEIDSINREVEDIIQLPPEPNPPLMQLAQQKAPLAPVPSSFTPVQDSQFTLSTPVQMQVATPQTPAPMTTSAPMTILAPPTVTVQLPEIPTSQAQYSASIPSSSAPVSLSVSDTPAPSHPPSAPQSASQATASTDTALRETSFNQFAPPPEDVEDNCEFKAEAVPEIVTIKDEPMSDHSALLPTETLHHLMNTLHSNEENIGVSNLVTTAQPSSLQSTFLDKANNPLSMLTLSNSNISSLFPVSDSLPGSSRGGELKSLMDNKAGGSGSASNPSCSGSLAEDDDQREAFYLAKILCNSSKWTKLRCHLKSAVFSPLDQSVLQTLWYSSLYEDYKSNRKLKFLTPAQRYRIRRSNPLPDSLSATKFCANKFFDDKTRSIMDHYFTKSKYVLPNDSKDLVTKTGLKLQQIKNYFKNKRSRTKNPGECSVPEEINVELGEIMFTRPMSFIKIEPMSFE